MQLILICSPTWYLGEARLNFSTLLSTSGGPPVSGTDDTGAVARNNDDEKIAELWIRRKEWTLLANLGGFLELILLPIYIFRADTFIYIFRAGKYF